MAHEQADYQLVLGDRGRLVIPADVRRRLGLRAGSRLALTIDDDGSLRLRSYRTVAEATRGMLAGLVSEGASPVDELIAERRAEAQREDAEDGERVDGSTRAGRFTSE